MNNLEQVLNELAERVAALVVERLQAGAPGMIAQTGSPLGRRHCAAVRRRVSRGEPGAAIIGRRHLLSPEAMTEELSRVSKRETNNVITPAASNVRAELERELRLLPCHNSGKKAG